MHFTLTSTGAYHPKTEPTGAATDLSPVPSGPVLCTPVVSKWHTWKGTPQFLGKMHYCVWDSFHVWVHGNTGIASWVYGRTMFSISLRFRAKDPYPGSWEPRDTFLSFGSDTRLSLWKMTALEGFSQQHFLNFKSNNKTRNKKQKHWQQLKERVTPLQWGFIRL